MPQRIVQLDAFTDSPFGGNPAAICVMERAGDEEWMQNVALEMNLSETAYVVPLAQGFSLRWFTPAAEVDLCGHATVAAAHVLWEDGIVGLEEACIFETRSGRLEARRDGDWITVRFPFESTEARPAPEGLSDALGVVCVEVHENRLGYLVVEVEDEEIVRGLSPDFSLLKALPFHGYAVTSRSASDDFDFVSRFFGPRLGIDEDPVTGSAHCVLGPYWRDRLGKDTMLAYQASARGGVVKVHVEDEYVELGGQAVTVMRGELV